MKGKGLSVHRPVQHRKECAAKVEADKDGRQAFREQMIGLVRLPFISNLVFVFVVVLSRLVFEFLSAVQ